MRRWRDLIGMALTGALLAALAACGAGGAGGSSGSDGGAAGGTAGAWPVSIRSAVGTADIEKRPQRVVTLGWGSDDAALALGVTPVGMAINVPDAPGGITPWARAALGGSRPTMFKADGSSIPYEQIAALRPDVILAVFSGLTKEQFATLSKIAPVVGYPDQPWATTWTDQVRIVGKALGRGDRAEQLVARVQRQVEQAAAEHPEFRGRTAIFGSGTKPGSFNLYVPSDTRMQLLGQLGFTVSDAATATFDHAGSPTPFATSVSLEQLPRLKADVLVSWYLSSSTRTSIERQPVFAALAPVKNGAYVPITDSDLVFATSAPNVLSIPWMLRTYVPLLSAAAKAS